MKTPKFPKIRCLYGTPINQLPPNIETLELLRRAQIIKGWTIDCSLGKGDKVNVIRVSFLSPDGRTTAKMGGEITDGLKIANAILDGLEAIAWKQWPEK